MLRPAVFALALLPLLTGTPTGPAMAQPLGGEGVYIQLNPQMVPMPAARTQKFQIFTARLFPINQEDTSRACAATPRAGEAILFYVNETPMLPTDFIDFGLEDLEARLKEIANQAVGEDLFRKVEVIVGTAPPAEHSRTLSRNCR